MFLLTCPTLVGHRRPLSQRVKLSFASALALSSVFGCSKPSEVSDWKLTPPNIHNGENRVGVVSTMSRGPSPTVVSDPAAWLEFAPQDRSLPLMARTECFSLGETTDAVSGQESATTSQHVDVARLLPLPVFSPERAARNWNCKMEITVSHPSGSTHRFQLEAKALLISPPLSASLSGSNASLSLERGASLALVCPQWSSAEAVAAETPTTEGTQNTTSTALMLQKRIEVLSLKSKIVGIDDRSVRRRPHCRVIAQNVSERKVISDLTLQFPPPKIFATRSVIVPNARSYEIARSPVFSWTVQHDGGTQTLYRIAKPVLRLRLLAKSWTYAAVKTPYHFEYLDADVVASTETADFIRPRNAKSIQFRIVTNRDAFCFLMMGQGANPEVTNLAKFETESPMTIDSVANVSGENLNSLTPNSEVDQRQPIDILPHIILSEGVGSLMQEVPASLQTSLQVSPKPFPDSTNCNRGPTFNFGPGVTITGE